jgi:TonB-linked SusC/RagA family outer membrane protein
MRQDSGQIGARTKRTFVVSRGWRGAAIAALALVSSAAPTLAQQTRTVAGTVVSGGALTPIQGAEVRVQGAATSVFTDVSGRFRLTNLPSDEVTIVVRSIRYQPLTQTVRAGTTDLRLLMTETTVTLDQVVVTGTAVGEQQRAIGNAVSSINAAQELVRSGVGNVGNLINARAAGVIVTSGNGRAGAGTSMAIRGRSTISLNQEPLVYIDGVRVTNDVGTGTASQGGRGVSRINDISPEDIESIEIIKGPAAATIYGTEASNGVVQIITKRGRASEKPRWGLTLRQGTQWFQDAAGRIPTNYAKNATGQILSWNAIDEEKSRGVDIWTNGHLQTFGGNVSGGSSLIQYYLSSNFDKDKGIEPNNHLTRYTGTANLNITPGSKIDINSSIAYVTGKTHLGADYGVGTISGAMYGSPLALNTPSRGFGFGYPPEVVWGIFDNTQELDRFTGSITFNHRPLSWFTQRFIAGLDQTGEDNQFLQNFAPVEWRPLFTASGAKGQIVQDLRNLTYLTADYSGTAKFNITRSLLSSTSFGGQYYQKHARTSQVTGLEFPAPGLKVAAAAATRQGSQDYLTNTTVGLYAQEQLALNDRVFLTGAVRVDNNSAFGEDFSFATYPKVGAAWVISEEPFWKLGAINTLKLRAAYGQSGLQPDVFTALRTFQPVTGTADQPAVTPQLIGNSDLKPERGEEIEVGFEGLAFNRLTVDFTYFSKKTKDAILLRPVPPSTGFPGSQYVNIGEVSNHGVELKATLQALTRNDVAWDITGNIGTTADKIEDLGGIPFVTVPGGPTQRNVQGYPIAGQWAKRVTSATFDATTGRATNVQCDGGPGAQPLPCATAPLVFMGTVTPKVAGAVSNTVTLWKRLSLYGLVDFKRGNKILNTDETIRCAIFLVCDVNVNPQNYDPKFVANAQNGSSLQIVDQFIQDASFASLREISASYSIPERFAQKAGATRASITLGGRNLHRRTKYQGLDPESRALQGGLTNPFQAGFDQAVTPTLAQFIATLNLTF